MIQDQVRVYDGTDEWSGGMDIGREGRLINPNQYRQGENVVCRGGKVKTRPAFVELGLTFQNEIFYDVNGILSEAETGLGSEEQFQQGLFQGAYYFDSSIGADCIMASISGRLFRIVPRRTDVQITELSLAKQNRANIPIIYMVQADRFLVLQDGESLPIIYDGVSVRRSVKDEVPVGKQMAYGQGRLVVVGRNGRDILFGDLFGSHEGDPSLAVLKFTETNFLAEGGSASVPFTMGHIKGMVFYPQQDTSMGQGELLVFAEKGMASFFLSLPREEWKNSTFQRMGLLEIGGRGHRSFTAFNGDVWFRSGDGWRAYRQARAEAKGWFQLPLSTEVGNYVDVETPFLLEHGSSIRFKNRLIATCTPIPNQGKLYHNGLLSLDFNVLSSFGQSLKPSWDGHWNGIKVTQLIEGNFNGEHRAFAFGLDESGNTIYEITEEEQADSSGPITSSVTPRTFNFQAPFNENDLYGADVWFENVKKDTVITAYYKPDQYPNWIQWRPTTPISSLMPIEDAGELAGITTVADGFKPRKSLGKPERFTDNLSTKRDSQRTYELQTKLEWTGYAAISRYRIHGKTKVEKANAEQ